MKYASIFLSTAMLFGFLTNAEPGCGEADADADGYTIAQGDCDDNDPAVNPGAEEVCDSIDNNCDGYVDEGFDEDEDGYSSCDGDCDDADPAINPGVAEQCDGIDENCDGEVDEGFDQDGDGSTTCGGDCNDMDAGVFPGAEELCNSVDENCDGEVDEGFDADGDGATTCAGDCDDLDPTVRPGMQESCNAVDDNCDGAVDEGFDADGDGFTTCAGDCDDEDPDAYPDAPEQCDGLDNNCDGSADDGFDADGDGYRICDGDCDDGAAEVNPGATELCNSIDDNCDGATDEGFDADQDGYTTCAGDCADGRPDIHPDATERCNFVDDNCDGNVDEGFDQDGDSYTICDGDCDDSSASVYPYATESCNGVDDDCDLSIDEGFDQDADGYTSCQGDCDDSNEALNPGQYEGPDQPTTTTDGLDNDCDGYVDIDCDGSSGHLRPAVELDSPDRGLFTSSSTVSVVGRALPAIGGGDIVSVTVNGEALDAQVCSDAGGVAFDSDVAVDRGLTTLRVRAEDIDGDSNKAERSLVESDRFIDLSGPISGALVGELNQGTWDILGSYLENYLTAEELEAELLASNPVVNDSGSTDCTESYQIYGNATKYTHDYVEITFTVDGSRIDVTARIVYPRIWAEGWAKYDLEWYCGGWSDTVGLDAYASFSEVRATGSGMISTDENGVVSVRFTHVDVEAWNAYLEVTADQTIYDWLIDFFEEDLEQELTDFIETELYDYVSQDLGPLLADEINAMVLDYTLDVWGTPYDVAFDIESASVGGSTVDVGFGMGLDYAIDPRVPENPGAVGYPTSHSHTTSPTVSFKIGLDFFNSALHALWEGGSLYLEGTLEESPLMTGTTDPLLPPVVMPGDSPYLMEVNLGDVITSLNITASDGHTESLSAAMSATVAMDIDPQINGYLISFDVIFSDVSLTFELLGDMELDEELQASMEAGLSEMLSMYLLELESYLESLEISYFDLPVTFTSMDVMADSSNPAMITVTGNAVYSGE